MITIQTTSLFVNGHLIKTSIFKKYYLVIRYFWCMLIIHPCMLVRCKFLVAIATLTILCDAFGHHNIIWRFCQRFAINFKNNQLENSFSFKDTYELLIFYNQALKRLWLDFKRLILILKDWCQFICFLLIFN